MFLVRPTADPLSGAFDRKFVIHAGLASKPTPPEEIQAAYERLLESRPDRGLGLYVHIPFCRSQCLYCGFGGPRPEPAVAAAYVEALLAELEWLKDKAAAAGPVRVIYLGGGTPTSLAPDLLGRLMDSVGKNLDLANDCEITLEGRLHDFTPEKTSGFLAAGFNRFSIGVQSFDTRIRQSLGRLSPRATVVEYLENLISRQKAAVIIDLIYGLPGQSPDDFIDDLKQAEALGLDGLDAYQLNIFKGGQLAGAIESGRLTEAAPLSAQGEYYRRAGEYLLGRRWRQLSLSHFALSARERNLYNPWAKRRGDCLALGAGAGGFFSGWSFYRRPRVEAYLEACRRGLFLPDALSPPAPNGRLVSFIVEQMEQGYLNHRRLTEDFMADPAPLRLLLENWAENGLMIMDDEWATMTMTGRFWGVNLTQAVIETASRNMKENQQ
jgi:oxygen-independent coproporphyrinogen-3 oxidase